MASVVYVAHWQYWKPGILSLTDSLTSVADYHRLFFMRKQRFAHNRNPESIYPNFCVWLACCSNTGSLNSCFKTFVVLCRFVYICQVWSFWCPHRLSTAVCAMCSLAAVLVQKLTASQMNTMRNMLLSIVPCLCYLKHDETRNVGQCPTWWTPCPVPCRKVWLTPTTRVPCSNTAKTRNPLKFAAVPQTNEMVSAASGPKFTILWGRGGDTAA